MDTETKKDDVMEAMLEVFGGLEKVEAIKQGPDETFCEFVLSRMGRIESARAAMAQRFIEINRQLDNEKKGLKFLFDPNLRAATNNLLARQGGKKKSVKLLTGTVGYRAGKDKLVIEDMKKVIKWCAEKDTSLLIKAMSAIDINYLQCLMLICLPDGTIEPNRNIVVETNRLVKSLNVGPLLEHYQNTCVTNKETGEEVPGKVPDGCKFVEAENKFFATPAVAKLEGSVSNG